MKRIFTEISAFAFIVAVLFSAGCLSDDLGRSDNGSGTGSTEPTIPDNSVIDAGMFSALNLDYPGLAAVKAYYDSDQYYLAAQALLEYYRGRTDVINGNVNLIAPSISAQEQEWADYALVKNEYRFYNGTYMDGDKPYSYLTSNKIDWAKRVSGDLEERYSLHRHQWMVPQGKAYRTSLDETYTYRVGDGLRGLADEFPPPDGRCGLRGRSLDAARGVARGALRLASDRRGLPRREPVRPALLFHAIDLLHAAAAFEVPGQSRRAGRAYQGALFGGCRYEGYGGPCRVPCRHDLPRDEEGRRVGRERLGVDERGHRRQRVRSAESRLQRPDEGEARL